MPRIGSGSPEGFSHDLLGLLEQLLAEALASQDEDDDEALDEERDDELPAFPALVLRRGS